MTSENETVVDICAKLKDVANGQNVRNDGLVIEIYQEEIWGALGRIEAAHQREVAELKSKMNDVVCENEALRDACGTCGAKLEVAELEREVAELRSCLKMAVVNARIARECYAFGRECASCGQSCNARKWKKVIEATKGAEDEDK